MKYIVFDTETTGLPKDYKASAKDVDNWPRIIQLAWVIFDENEAVLKSRCELIKPNGWVVPKEKFWLEHGYSTEGCEANGVDLQPLVQELIEDMNGCDLLISHNMAYDSKVLGAEMYRMKLDTEGKIKKFCTKEASTDFCQLTPKMYGRFKWPKLIELHRKLFGTAFEDAHDALADVKACGRCFFEMKRRGIIKIDL